MELPTDSLSIGRGSVMYYVEDVYNLVQTLNMKKCDWIV